MKTRFEQKGLGLVEVMIALFILLLAAMASARIQSMGMLSAQMSSFHLSLNHLSSEMLETLRANPDAANAGVFNFDLIPEDTTTDTDGDTDGDTDDDSVDIDARMLEWNTRVGDAIPLGAGTVSCAAGICDVVISWMEEIDGSYHRQFYRTRTRI